MRTALVHYWLVNMRGGEKVLEALCRLFPEADIYTHVVVPEKLSPTLRRRSIRTTFIQRLPFSGKGYRRYLPLMPLALEQLDLRKYDMVISSESGPAKGVLTRADTPHICYCHTPMRYLWDFYPEYLEEAGAVTRFFMRLFFHYLRMWDTLSANRVDAFAANSRNVAARVKRVYRREAEVIYPPVDIDRFAPERGQYAAPQEYYLYLGQLVGYKRADVAVEAFSRMGKRLIVAGEGPEEKRLRAAAGPSVEFTGQVDGDIAVRMMQECKALIFPGEEDFGIVPVEAAAAGRPTIAYAAGGALETIRDGETGIFFAEQTPESLMGAVDRFESLQDAFQPEKLTEHARRFSEAAFASAFMRLVEKTLEERQRLRAG